jgi:hypothetical protein
MAPASNPSSHVLSFVVAALFEVVAEHCEKYRTMLPIIPTLWRRLHITAARFQILFTRWSEGRLPPPRKPAPRKPHPRPKAENPDPVLPRGNAWLTKRVPQTDIFGTQLRYLLADLEIATFLAEVPQAGRMLLPLCRMLGVTPLPHMRPPKRQKPPPPPEQTPTSEQTFEKPPPRPPSAAQAAYHARRRWFAENIAPRLSRRVSPDDPSHVRPVSLWCSRTRPRT